MTDNNNNSDLHYLDRKWDLWYHDPNNNCYTLDSYIKLGCIDTIETFWHYYYQLKLSQLQNGMLFLMTEGTVPTWEDNLEGGSWSYKIDKKDIPQAWSKLSVYLLSNNFVENSDNNSSSLYNEVVGISISPKKTFSIFKLWVKDDKVHEQLKFRNDLPFIKHEESLYRSHMDTKEKEEKINNVSKSCIEA